MKLELLVSKMFIGRKVDKRLSKSCPKELAKKLETKNIRKKTKFL